MNNENKPKLFHFAVFVVMLAAVISAIAYYAKARADGICRAQGFAESRVKWNLGSFCFNGRESIPVEQIQ